MSGVRFGVLLRRWRERRQWTQLALAEQANVSARHLSFMETGRSGPSRELVLRLAEVLDVPARERNGLLEAAGYAPCFPQRGLNDAGLAPARAVIERMLEQQKPYPAFAIDRYHDVVAYNGGLPELFDGVAEALLRPPMNVVRLSLHPEGMSRRVKNLGQWRQHLLRTLRREIEQSHDERLIELEREVLSYAAPDYAPTAPELVAIPLQVEVAEGVLSFFTSTMVFGTAVDVAGQSRGHRSAAPGGAPRELDQRLCALGARLGASLLRRRNQPGHGRLGRLADVRDTALRRLGDE